MIFLVTARDAYCRVTALQMMRALRKAEAQYFLVLYVAARRDGPVNARFFSIATAAKVSIS